MKMTFTIDQVKLGTTVITVQDFLAIPSVVPENQLEAIKMMPPYFQLTKYCADEGMWSISWVVSGEIRALRELRNVPPEQIVEFFNQLEIADIMVF